MYRSTATCRLNLFRRTFTSVRFDFVCISRYGFARKILRILPYSYLYKHNAIYISQLYFCIRCIPGIGFRIYTLCILEPQHSSNFALLLSYKHNAIYIPQLYFCIRCIPGIRFRTLCVFSNHNFCIQNQFKI